MMILSKRSNVRPMLAACLSASIMLQPVFGLRAHAQDQGEDQDFEYAGSRGEEVYPEGSPAALGQLALQTMVEQGVNARLPLTPAQRNVFFILGQRVIDRKTGEVIDITQMDLSAKQMNIGPGVLERSLEVAVDGNDIVLSYPKSRYLHKIPLGTLAAKSITLDNEYVNILTKTGELLVIDVFSLRKLIFQSSVPVFTVGKVFENANMVLETTEIKIIQRRNPSIDQSQNALDAELDLQESTKERVLGLADQRLVETMERTYQKVRYIPLSDRMLEQHKYLSAGDIAVTQGTEGVDQHIVKILQKPAIAQEVGKQLGAFQAMLAIANDHTEDTLQELRALDQEGRAMVEEIVQDDRTVQDYFASGLAEAVLKIPHESALTIRNHAAEVVAQEGALASRDRFTAQEWHRDAEYFARTIELAREKVEDQTRFPRWLNRLGMAVSDRWQEVFQPSSVRKLTTFLSCVGVACASAVTVNALSNNRASGLALDVMAGSYHWLLSKFPVLMIDGYPSLLATSQVLQAQIPVVIFAGAMLAAPFTLHQWAKLPSLVGIRTYAVLFQNHPLRILAFLTRQRTAFNALRHGHLAMPVPVTNSDQRTLSEEAVTRVVRAQKLKNSLATVIALGVVASREGIDAGELYVSAKGGDPHKGAGAIEAMEVSDEIQRRMREMSTSQIEEFLEMHENALLSEVRTYREASAKLSLPEARRSWWLGWSEYVRTRVKIGILKKIGNYSTDTYEELSNAVPDDYTARLINRGYVIDFVLSLPIAGTIGDWANPAMPEKLHGQANAFLYTNPVATTENINQTGIHMMRSAAGNQLLFSAAASGVNLVYKPAELMDLQEKQVPALKPFFKEAWEVANLLLNFRKSQPGEILGKSSYNGRVRLFQSTLAMGIIPRILIGGQTVEQAILGQLMFMADAMWAFGWPWMPIYGAQRAHEPAIEKKYAEFKNLQVALSQSVRLNDESRASMAIFEMRKFYQEADLSVPDLPDQYVEEKDTAYADRLLSFSQLHHPVAHRQSNLIGNMMVTAGTIATTFLATFFYNRTFSNNIHWLGVNLTNWDIFTQVPAGDGIFSVAMKATIFVTIAWGGQRFFNWVNDSARLNVPYYFNPKNPIERAELIEKRDEAKKKFKEFGPVKAAIKAKELVGSGCNLLFGS